MDNKKEKPIVLELKSYEEVQELLKIVNVASQSIGISDFAAQNNCIHFGKQLNNLINARDKS